MPLDDQTKARLKEAAERKRGRTNLSGLDRTTGLVGLDYVQERRDAGAVPHATVRGSSGYLEYRPEVGVSPLIVRDKNGLSAIFTRNRCVGERPHRYDWVVLRFCPDWVPDEFAGRFPCRKIRVSKFKGPGTPRDIVTKTALPIPLVVDWFRFLWPDPKEWGPRAERYFACYSTRYTEHYPGVGQKVVFEDDVINGLSGVVEGPCEVVSWVGAGFWVKNAVGDQYCAAPDKSRWTLAD